MNTRNPKYNQHGTIDCEIEHPEFGWIPFTASPDDVDENGREIHAALIEAGNIEAYTPHVKTQEELDAELLQEKEAQKQLLIQEKLAAMLTAEFAEIDAAKTKDELKNIKLK